MDPFHPPKYRLPIDATFNSDYTQGWSGAGSAADRSLSHNGGYIPTRDYLSSTLGVSRVSPEEYGVDKAGKPLPSAQPRPSEADIARFGKFSLGIMPPRYSNITPSIEQLAAAAQVATPDQAPKTVFGTDQGFVSQVLGGLTDLFTGFLPHEIQDPIVNVASGIGAALDLPLEAVSHVNVGPSVEQAFAMVQDTPEKQALRELMEADSIHAEWYMGQYLRSHGGDLAAAQGISQAFAAMIQPGATLLERAMGVLNLGSFAVSRTLAGGDALERFDTIMQQPRENLPDNIGVVRDRYERGDYGTPGTQEAKERFLDEIVNSGAGLSDNVFINMIAEMATDPVMIAGLGTGIAVKSIGVGAFARRLSTMVRDIPHAAPVVQQAYRLAERAEELARVAPGHRSVFDAATDVGRRFVKDPTPEVQDFVRQQTKAMPAKDQAILAAQPFVEAAASISGALNSPFRVFGNDGIAGVMRQRWGRKNVAGLFSAFGTAKVAGFLGALDETARAGLLDAIGHAAAFQQNSMVQDSITMMTRVLGKGEKASYSPNAVNPNVVARNLAERMDLDNPRAAQEAEINMRYAKHDFTPRNLEGLDDDARKVEYDRQMDVHRERATEQVMAMSGLSQDAARAIVGNADEDLLAFIHWAHFGHTIREVVVGRGSAVKAATARFDAANATRTRAQQAVDAATTPAKKAAAQKRLAKAQKAYDKAQDDIAKASRVTLMSEHHLTEADAKVVLKDIALGLKGDRDAIARVRDATGRFADLRRNFAGLKVVEEGEIELLRQVQTHLRELIKAEALPTILTDAALRRLAPEVADYLRDAATRLEDGGYRAGLMPSPERVWQPTMDKAGNYVGYHPWMDIAVSPTDVYAPTRLDVLREHAFKPIRAENVLRESRSKFVRKAVRTYGYDRRSAAVIFEAIRQAGRERLATARGFTHAELLEIAKNADIPPEMKNKLGGKDLAFLVAQAMEGDLSQVGLTAKVTGIMKTQSADYGNFMGVLAEKIYPLVRFQLNPVFLVQEWIEPYFFNILRGVKSGVRYTDADVENHAVIEQLNRGNLLTDGEEVRDVRVNGAVRTRAEFGPQTPISRLVTGISRGKIGRVHDVKALAYQTLLRKQFAEKVIRSWDKISPTFFGRMKAELDRQHMLNGGRGTLSREEAAWRWLQHKGFADPDRASTEIHLWDGGKPDTLGRIDGIRSSYVARWAGYDSAAALRADIAVGALDEHAFRTRMLQEGHTREYASRSWAVMNSRDMEEFLDDLTRELPDQASIDIGKDLMRGLIEAGSVIRGISPEEYIATRFADQTHWLDSSGRIPRLSYLQVWDREAEYLGIPKIEVDDARWTAARDITQGFMPSTPHPDAGKHLKQAHAAAALPPGAVPKGVDPAEAQHRTYEGVNLGTETKDAWKAANESVLGDDATLNAGEWYRQIGPRFAAVVEHMPDHYVQRLAEAMNEHMPSTGKIGIVRPQMEIEQALMRVRSVEADVPGRFAATNDADFEDKMGDTERGYGVPLRSKSGGEEIQAFDDGSGGAQTVAYYGPSGRIDGMIYLTEKTDVRLLPDEGDGVLRFANGQKNPAIGVVEVRPSMRKPPVKGVSGIGGRMYDLMQAEGYDIVGAVGRTGFTKAGKANALAFLERQKGAPAMAEMRAHVTARMLMAWGATQVRTSPRGGFGFLMRVLNDVTHGERPGAKKITLSKQETQLFKMLRDFEPTLNQSGLGPKLHDFIDSLLGNERRSLWRFETGERPTLNGRGLQPGAMDVWMLRERGYVDSPLIDHLAEKVAREQGMSKQDALTKVQKEIGFFHKKKGEKVEDYRARKAAFEKEQGIEPLREAHKETPSEAEYESMIRWYNDVRSQLNAEGYLGRRDWTVADMQAIAWVRIQKELGITAGGPLDMFYGNSAQVTFEVNPAKNAPLSDHAPFGRMNIDQQDIVTGHVTRVMADIVQRETGVSIQRSTPGRGAWVEDGANTYMPNTVWEVMGSPEAIEDAIDMIQILSQQNTVLGYRPAVAATKSGKAPRGAYRWVIDFEPGAAHAGPEVLDDLSTWLDGRGIPWNGHGAVHTPEGAAVRTMYAPAPKKAADRVDGMLYVKDGTDFTGFEQAITIDDETTRLLTSGEWVLGVKGWTGPLVPVSVNRSLSNVYEAVNDFADDVSRRDALKASGVAESVANEEIGRAARTRLEARGRGGITRALADQHVETIKAVYDQSIKHAAPDVWAQQRGVTHLLDQAPDNVADIEHHQRLPRGWGGATHFGAGHRATVYLNRQQADLTTLVHETFHVFARDLDPSAVEAIHSAYATAAHRPKPTGNALTRPAEEWVAKEFEKWLAQGFDPDEQLRLGPIFNAYADWGRRTGAERVVEPGTGAVRPYHPRLQDVFDSVTPKVHGQTMAVWDAQQFRILEAARIAFVAAEEEAFKAHYYARGRTWLERSANHPYLGLYPLSYMWGKVLPELTRFLVKTPFGIDAPFAGMQMANHVWNAIQTEVNTDEEGGLADLVKQIPESIHMLELFLPGNPWNVPVNAPAWMRHLGQSVLKGEDIDITDAAGAVSDTVAYAFGPGRAPRDAAEMLQEMTDTFSGQQPEPEEDQYAGLAQAMQSVVQ